MADAQSVKKSRELADRFLSVLEKAGVEVKSLLLARASSNSRILKKGGVRVGILLRVSGLQMGWWGVNKNGVDQMEREQGSNWGVIFLLRNRSDTTLDGGYWVDGKHWDKVLPPAPDQKGQYHFSGRDLEGNSYAQRFRTVDEFLQCAHL